MNTYLYGKVLDFDVVNGNNRIYPKDEAIRAIEAYKSKPNKLSEVNPSKRTMVIDLDNVGAVCEEFVIEDSSVYAKLRILTSTKGRQLTEQLGENVKTMLSLRGAVNPLWINTDVLQVNELEIISIDVLPFDGRDESTICTVSTDSTS